MNETCLIDSDKKNRTVRTSQWNKQECKVGLEDQIERQTGVIDEALYLRYDTMKACTNENNARKRKKIILR